MVRGLTPATSIECIYQLVARVTHHDVGGLHMPLIMLGLLQF
jgi:hypothetical protein